jgi:hypothetical protein
MRTTSAATVAALACLVLAACAPQAPATPPGQAPGQQPAAPARAGGILRFGQNAADVGTVDPHYASGTQDRALVDMVFNALVRFKPGDGTQFEPDLATELPQPTMEGGKQSWTFTLRSGVMCHPSEGISSYELTSEDVVYSLQKAASKDSSAYSADYAGMAFEAVNPRTVRVTLDTPLSTALFYPRVANYSGGYILCKRPAEQLGLLPAAEFDGPRVAALQVVQPEHGLGVDEGDGGQTGLGSADVEQRALALGHQVGEVRAEVAADHPAPWRVAVGPQYEPVARHPDEERLVLELVDHLDRIAEAAAVDDRVEPEPGPRTRTCSAE